MLRRVFETTRKLLIGPARGRLQKYRLSAKGRALTEKLKRKGGRK